MFPVNNVANEAFVIFESDMPEPKTRAVLSNSNVPFKVLVGQYKGIESTAYIVNLKDGAATGDLTYHQESVLVLEPVSENGLRKATLQYNPNSNSGIPEQIEYIGYFKPVDEAYAKTKDSYTYDPTTNQYYVAE